MTVHDYFAGDHSTNLQQGRGQYLSEGSKYVGMWKHDLMHGEGEFEKDGSHYKGEFFQGVLRLA